MRVCNASVNRSSQKLFVKTRMHGLTPKIGSLGTSRRYCTARMLNHLPQHSEWARLFCLSEENNRIICELPVSLIRRLKLFVGQHRTDHGNVVSAFAHGRHKRKVHHGYVLTNIIAPQQVKGATLSFFHRLGKKRIIL